MRTIGSRFIMAMLTCALLGAGLLPVNTSQAAVIRAADMAQPALQTDCGTGLTNTLDVPSLPGAHTTYKDVYLGLCSAYDKVAQLKQRANSADFCMWAATLGFGGSIVTLYTTRGFSGFVAIGSAIVAIDCAALKLQFSNSIIDLERLISRCTPSTAGVPHPGIAYRVSYSTVTFGISNLRCQPERGKTISSVPPYKSSSMNIRIKNSSIDYALVIDTTGSMQDDLASVRARSTEIINQLAADGSNYRIAIVIYNDPWARTVLNFTADRTAAISALNSLTAEGGGDTPEHVYNGLMTAINLPWRTDAFKSMILIGDAPPKDPEPGTGYTQATVVNAANAKGIATSGRTGLAKPLMQATPSDGRIMITSLLIGTDPSARTSFLALATQTAGRLVETADASTIVQSLINTLERNEDPPSNISVAQPATQIQDPFAATNPAWLAVDGNTNGGSDSELTRTNSQIGPSWTVDLGSVRTIEEIRVWHNTACCYTSRADYHVLISDTPFTSSRLSDSLAQAGVTNIFRAGWSSDPNDLFAVKRTGRYVRIQLAGNVSRVLRLAEVEVFGR